MSKYENLQKKPGIIPFLCIVLQIYLACMFLGGTFTVFGMKINLISVFELLYMEPIDPNSPVTTFNSFAAIVISAIYIAYAVSMIKTVFATFKQSSQLKKLLKAEVFDVAQVRGQLGIMVSNVKHLVYLSLTFLCYSRLLSVYAMKASMAFHLLAVLLICMFVEAKYLSYIQGKRFFFSFAKSLCGYLFGIVAVVLIFHLKNMTFFDYVYGLFWERLGTLPVDLMDCIYYIYIEVIVYVAPLLFALGTMYLFRLMFKKSKHATNSAQIARGTNSYLISAVVFMVLTCVLFGLRDQMVSFDYYFKIVLDYAAIILGAITAKLLITMANRRIKYPVKLIEVPAHARHTLD